MSLRLYFDRTMKKIMIGTAFLGIAICVVYMCLNLRPRFHRTFLRYIGEEQPPIIEHYIKSGGLCKICAVIYRDNIETNIYDRVLCFKLNSSTNVEIKSFNQKIYPSLSELRAQYTNFSYQENPPFLICTNFTMTREYKSVLDFHSDSDHIGVTHE